MTKIRRSYWEPYKLRLRRKRLLFRAFRKRRELVSISRKTGSIKDGDVLLFATVRNEALRLPHFLTHYRQLGVAHFLFVDNSSSDSTRAILKNEPDVSLWQTATSYKASRFGMDWLTALQWRYGHGHWCVTVDADELLIYPDCQTHNLAVLGTWLANNKINQLGALMLDMYPKGPIGSHHYKAGEDPVSVISWFDPYGYWVQLQTKLGNLWCQGGPRARVFFPDTPERAPTLNKIPFVFWQRSYVYVNSTHNALPITLNQTWSDDGSERVSGVLLHTKFLPDAVSRAQDEKQRKEHFADPAQYGDYYDAVANGPDLWTETSARYVGEDQLVDLALMTKGSWPPG